MTKTEIVNLAIYHIGGRALFDVDSDPTQAGIVARAWFDTTRDDMLRSHPWNFATKRTRLFPTYFNISTVTNASGVFRVTATSSHALETGDRVLIENVEGVDINGEWDVIKFSATAIDLRDSTYATGYTSSTGRMRQVPSFDFTYIHFPPTDFLRIIGLEHNQDVFSVEAGRILSNSEELPVRYIAKVDNPASWPADFSNAFSYLLASNMVQALNGDAGKALELRKIYEQMIAPMVKIRDSREGRAVIRDESEYSDLVNSRMGGRYR